MSRRVPSFTSPLLVRIEQGERDGRGLATLLEPFYHRDGDRTIIVPAGFVTDFTSVPWWAAWLVPILGEHAKAAVLHDYLLERTDLPYDEVNRIFAGALRALGVSGLRYLLLTTAVRLKFLGRRR